MHQVHVVKPNKNTTKTEMSIQIQQQNQIFNYKSNLLHTPQCELLLRIVLK